MRYYYVAIPNSGFDLEHFAGFRPQLTSFCLLKARKRIKAPAKPPGGAVAVFPHPLWHCYCASPRVVVTGTATRGTKHKKIRREAC
jgi:hypothetical protein